MFVSLLDEVVADVLGTMLGATSASRRLRARQIRNSVQTIKTICVHVSVVCLLSVCVEEAKAGANTWRRCEETLRQRLVAVESHGGHCDSLFAVRSGDLDKCLLDIKQGRTSNGP